MDNKRTSSPHPLLQGFSVSLAVLDLTLYTRLASNSELQSCQGYIGDLVSEKQGQSA